MYDPEVVHYFRRTIYVQVYVQVFPPHLQKVKRIFSKTRTGPVLPRMVSGCPANREYATPVIEAPNRDSMALYQRQRERLMLDCSFKTLHPPQHVCFHTSGKETTQSTSRSLPH